MVEESDLDLMVRRLLNSEARRLIMLVVPEAGPPVTISVGYLLPGGEVSLDPGLQVAGIYWENLDRIVHTNGTIGTIR